MRAIGVALALALVLLASAPSRAQELIAEYYALIGAEDMYNSRGERLGDFCSVVQQDRANYHRFGIRQDSDTSDPIFHSREARAMILGRCRIVQGSEYIPTVVLDGQTRFIWVRVYGHGGIPTEIWIAEGAG